MRRTLVLLALAAGVLALLMAVRRATHEAPGGAAVAPSGPTSALRLAAAEGAAQALPLPLAPSGGVEEEAKAGDVRRRSLARAAFEPDPRIQPDAGAETLDPLFLEVEPGVAHLSGTLTALEWDGAPIPAVSGLLELHLWCDRRASERLAVTVEAGAWSAQLDPERGCRELEIRHVTVDGRPARLDAPHGRVGIPRGRDLPVRVRLPRPSLLHVLDVNSGLPLEDVALAPAAYLPGPGFLHPGSGAGARIAARGLASPVSLEGHLERMRQAGDLDPPSVSRGARDARRDGRPPEPAILVGAEGYAWERIELGLLRGRETRLGLTPAAELLVHVTGIDPGLGGDLRLYREEAAAPCIQESVFGDRTIELGSLHPGNYRVAVELGRFDAVQDVLASQAAFLRAGERNEVHLHCVAAAVQVTADAAGRVSVPEAWRIRDLTVALRQLGPDGTGAGNRHPARAGRGYSHHRGFTVFEWSMSGLQIGRYELSTVDPPFQALVELPASGNQDLRHELPPPVLLEVTLLDVVRGEPHPGPSLRWRPATLPNLPPLPWSTVLANDDEDPIRVRVPAGSIELVAELEGFLPYAQALELSARSEAHAHAIDLLPRTAIALSLVSEGALVELPSAWKPTLRPQSASARTLPADPVPHERRFFVSEPGRYSLDLPSIPGFRRPAPQDVEVPPGKVCAHVVELERE